jgi:hypothetical protein
VATREHVHFLIDKLNKDQIHFAAMMLEGVLARPFPSEGSEGVRWSATRVDATGSGLGNPRDPSFRDAEA